GAPHEEAQLLPGIPCAAAPTRAFRSPPASGPGLQRQTKTHDAPPAATSCRSRTARRLPSPVSAPRLAIGGTRHARRRVLPARYPQPAHRAPRERIRQAPRRESRALPCPVALCYSWPVTERAAPCRAPRLASVGGVSARAGSARLITRSTAMRSASDTLFRCASAARRSRARSRSIRLVTVAGLLSSHSAIVR